MARLAVLPMVAWTEGLNLVQVVRLHHRRGAVKPQEFCPGLPSSPSECHSYSLMTSWLGERTKGSLGNFVRWLSPPLKSTCRPLHRTSPPPAGLPSCSRGTNPLQLQLREDPFPNLREPGLQSLSLLAHLPVLKALIRLHQPLPLSRLASEPFFPSCSSSSGLVHEVERGRYRPLPTCWPRGFSRAEAL